MKQSSSIRVRFAPSPTGYLHIGSLRTALFNWLLARHCGGTYLVRIEDTDLERGKQEYFDAIFETLSWAGLEPDEPIIIQSHRLKEHQEVIKRLCDEGKAYYCFCSSEDVANRVEAFHKDGDILVKYDQKCRSINKNQIDLSRPHAVRFKIPDGLESVSFHDLIRGEIVIPIDQLDDFIIARSDGRPIYNFVVVVDDMFMRITHVIRGEDHISNTPKQILLYQACGYTVPQFAHLPLILGPSGDRLSKRDAATSANEYRDEGYLPQALLNYLVRLGWAHGDQEIFTIEELISYFSLEAIGSKGSIFDIKKLAWVNSIYIQQMESSAIISYIEQYMNFSLTKRLSNWSYASIEQAILLYKERISTLKELMTLLISVHDGPKSYTEFETVCGPVNETMLILFKEIEAEISNNKMVDVQPMIKQLCAARAVSLSTVMPLLRYVVSGSNSGPGVFALISVIGIEVFLVRLTNFILCIEKTYR